jgi:glutamate dehydrogenase
MPLSPQMQKLLGTTAGSASGEEVIRRLLAAPWDLLYNGGIGTYVKASDESNADAGDRANDRVRVNGNDIRARVIGEGGNLGFTQRARIECWMHGGLINTDALDNSAGVDTSDHEVNLKIFLDMLVKKLIVKDKEERNRILAEMTEEVAELVLLDNELQSRALTLDGLRSANNYEDFVDLIDEMKNTGIIDPYNVHIPSREALLQSAQRSRGLPRPLLADLLGYVKMWGYEKLLRSDLPDNPIARPFLESYFPLRLRGQFSEYFLDHPLRKEITATAMVNYVTNNGGISLLPRFETQYKGGLIAAVSKYIVADREINAGELRRNTLQSGLSAKAEHEELLRIEEKIGDANLFL